MSLHKDKEDNPPERFPTDLSPSRPGWTGFGSSCSSGLELDELSGPFQPKPFHGSVIDSTVETQNISMKRHLQPQGCLHKSPAKVGIRKIPSKCSRPLPPPPLLLGDLLRVPPSHHLLSQAWLGFLGSSDPLEPAGPLQTRAHLQLFPPQLQGAPPAMAVGFPCLPLHRIPTLPSCTGSFPGSGQSCSPLWWGPYRCGTSGLCWAHTQPGTSPCSALGSLWLDHQAKTPSQLGSLQEGRVPT